MTVSSSLLAHPSLFGIDAVRCPSELIIYYNKYALIISSTKKEGVLADKYLIGFEDHKNKHQELNYIIPNLKMIEKGVSRIEWCSEQI